MADKPYTGPSVAHFHTNDPVVDVLTIPERAVLTEALWNYREKLEGLVGDDGKMLERTKNTLQIVRELAIRYARV